MPDEIRQIIDPAFFSRLETIELRARGIVEGFLHGLHRSPFVGFSVEFASHREYAPGDDLRHVNWKVFARQRKLYVKEFDAETNLNLYLFVDASRSMQCKVDGLLTKYEYAATLAAALASLAMKQHDAIALGLMDDGVTSYLEPSTKPNRWDECVQLLSRTPRSNTTALAKSLEQAAALARHRGIVVFLSDLVDDVEGIEKGLLQLRHRGHEVIIIQILDPCERYLVHEGRVRVLDMEGPGEVTTDAESVRQGYLDRVEAWCRHLETICLHQGVDLIELTTDQPPSEALVEYLVRRTT